MENKALIPRSIFQIYLILLKLSLMSNADVLMSNSVGRFKAIICSRC